MRATRSERTFLSLFVFFSFFSFQSTHTTFTFLIQGYTEVRWDEEKKLVVYEPLQLTQAFRNFDGAASPWEQVGPGVDSTPESFKIPPPQEEKAEEKK